MNSSKESKRERVSLLSTYETKLSWYELEVSLERVKLISDILVARRLVEFEI